MRKHACLLLLAVCVGCGGPRRAAPVDPQRARETIRTALDSWKAGKKVDEMPRHDPAITVQDFDWMTGNKLIAYELVDDGQPEDANLRIRVRLTLRQSDGRRADKTVTYIVGTDPVLTVFRAME